MSSNDVWIPVIVVAVIIFAIVRQMLPRQVSRGRFIIFPLIALYEAYRTFPQPTVSMHDVIECVIVVIMAFLAGTVQGWTVRVYPKDGSLVTQGGWMTVVSWFGFAIIRSVVGYLFQGPTYFTSFSSHAWILWVGVAFLFASRSFILYVRHPEIRSALIAARARR